MALQNAWNVCVLRYLGTNDKETRYHIINDFRDAIVDIKPDGAKALRKTFEEWEQNHLRFRKIMQVIQDSGIGLGAGKERGHYELSGFMGETSE